MSIYQGTYYARTFAIEDTDGNPVDITGWEFESDFRTRASSTTELLNLTTAGGGWAVTDGPNGQLEIRITAIQTEALPTGRLYFDVLRTDIVTGPRFMFQCRVRVRQPVTRD
jgi:hypothetical protein